MILKILIAFFSGALLAGCAATKCSEEVFLVGDVASKPFPPENFFESVPENGVLVPHRIEAVYGNNSWEADGVLRITPESLTLAASTPLGRLFTLVWRRDGELEFRNGFPGPNSENFNPRYLLFDLIIIYGNAPALEKYFSAPWKISFGEKTRELSFDGKKVAAVSYSESLPFCGHVRMENFVRNYRYVITNLE